MLQARNWYDDYIHVKDADYVPPAIDAERDLSLPANLTSHADFLAHLAGKHGHFGRELEVGPFRPPFRPGTGGRGYVSMVFGWFRMGFGWGLELSTVWAEAGGSEVRPISGRGWR